MIDHRDRLVETRTAGRDAVVTVIFLVGFMLWLASERSQKDGCWTNCPTDISASRR
jgi:hypothetical protein